MQQDADADGKDRKMSDGHLPKQYHIAWLDLIKAVALIWIFTKHVAENVFGGPYIANPIAEWPPLMERAAQLAPLHDLGLWTIPANALRYVGYMGDQGVYLFIIASGFGLTWGLLHRPSPYSAFKLKQFYLRRAERIFPPWWGAHLMFAVLWIAIGWGIPFSDPAFYLSMLGIRITPNDFYYFFAAWWYVGLLIQLYLVYPLLWQGLRRLGPTWLLIVICCCVFPIRGFGVFTVGTHMIDPWLRGIFFVTRLPEFVFGISLAAWLNNESTSFAHRLRSPFVILIAVLIYLAALPLQLTLAGMIIAPFLVGASAFAILYVVFTQAIERLPANLLRPGTWTGQHSYSLYLVHHAWIMLLIPSRLVNPPRVVVSVVVALVLTVASALLLEWSVARVTNWLRQPKTSRRFVLPFVVVATAGILLLGLLDGSELLVERFAPQEVLGWGERPALEPDKVLGWHLAPNRTTRLRWQGYDYVVTANSLGFPGSDHIVQKAPGVLGILVTGDGFTSAEGVNTSEAWPRLLEVGLAAKMHTRVEVLDFAVAGYGPEQYADVIEEYAPRYRPDLIVLQTSVDDLEEALADNVVRSSEIGFGAPAQDSLYATFSLLHLRQFIRLELIEPLGEFIRGKPRDMGYFLGSFKTMERHPRELEYTEEQKMSVQLRRISSVAKQIGAPLFIIMAPAAPQVCTRQQLAYYPRNVDLTDSDRYDVNLPQVLMSQIADSAGVTISDLRPVLKSATNECPYQAHNMHWTKAGHQQVAAYLIEQLIQVLPKH